VLCIWPSSEMTIIFMDLRKVAAAQKLLSPEVLSKDHVGDFLQLAGSHAHNLYQKDRLLTLNSQRSDGRTSKNFSVTGRTRLNEVTGSCCMIPTTQLLSSSYLQRKGLRFFTAPFTCQIWRLHNIYYSLKWIPTFRPLYWNHFRHPEHVTSKLKSIPFGVWY
jgi:hypothetical protein